MRAAEPFWMENEHSLSILIKTKMHFFRCQRIIINIFVQIECRCVGETRWPSSSKAFLVRRRYSKRGQISGQLSGTNALVECPRKDLRCWKAADQKGKSETWAMDEPSSSVRVRTLFRVHGRSQFRKQYPALLKGVFLDTINHLLGDQLEIFREEEIRRVRSIMEIIGQ